MAALWSLISSPVKMRNAAKDKESWLEALTEHKLLMDYTIRLQYGGKQGGLNVNCYRLDEIAATERTFKAYVASEDTWTATSLASWLSVHQPACMEPYFHRSLDVLYRCLIGCARFPFVSETPATNLTLDDLKRALAILTKRDAKLLSGQDFGTKLVLPRRSEEDLLDLLFRSMAHASETPSSKATTEHSWSQEEDIKDILCASQPTYPKIIYYDGRDAFAGKAAALQASRHYDFWMELHEMQSLIELLLALGTTSSSQNPGKIDQEDHQHIISKAASIISDIRSRGLEQSRIGREGFLQAVRVLPESADTTLARLFESMIDLS